MNSFCLILLEPICLVISTRGLTFTWWGCYALCFRHKPTVLAHSFLFCVCCLYGPSNCISFPKFSRQLSAFLLCCSGYISALLFLSIIYLFMKVSFSPDIILCDLLGLKQQFTYLLTARLEMTLCR